MLWLLSFAVESLYLKAFIKSRSYRMLGIGVELFVIVSTLLSISGFEPWFALAVALLTPFRVLNIGRAIKGRMHKAYLRRVTIRTTGSLLALHAAAYVLAHPRVVQYWTYFPYLLLAVAAGMFVLALLHILKTRHVPNQKHYSDKELPTVSVCIPARNETDSLEQCLRSVIANDYPKLEILVLDDCSQDKTAEVIKSFAQDGVRFVQGDPPADRWLAKNQAYDKLAREATGELIVFCGVDVRFGPHAIRALTTTLLNRNKSMISVMPLRFYSKFNEAFIQPMRYWWELVPPRKLVNRPPVLSTCWLIDRKMLKKAGGFSAVSHAIIPEGYFARRFIKDNQYSFIRADEELDVRTAKPVGEQWSTAVRTNYPQIRRRPEMALLLTVFTGLFLIFPFLLFLYGILTINVPLVIVAGATCWFLTVTHVLILQVSDPANVPLGFFNLPFASLMEVVIGYTSMLRYEFGTVEWKDRNICVPVMHVIPKKDFLRQASIED
jgi:glycosyltransferase involved in cell wall biosynthesis